MFDFCDKCGGMMLPSKLSEESVLECNVCGNIKALDGDLIDDYKFTKVIKHQTNP
ncbi:MAG: hypothetical protein EU539_05730 [Promethearchaeota archaeon]|nr:MAG: hypothetical protein EU539_05730 [Candidatus Lokiarchaeota archaeon]